MDADEIRTANLQRVAYTIATEHGFHHASLYASQPAWKLFAWSSLMLCVTELAEAAEELRDAEFCDDLWRITFTAEGKPEGFPVELADTVIRILDTAEELGIRDILEVARLKSAYNNTRPEMHGRGR